MPKNIVMLLAAPRSGSTVTEIVFANSGHFDHCYHEPNADHYYLDKDVTSTDRSKFRFQSYQQVKDEILAKAKEGRVFIKDMVHHFYKDISQDREFAEQIQFIFLIRDPIAAIRSHLTANPSVTSEEIGFKSMDFFALKLKSWGLDYRVVSYEQILADQARVFNSLFDFLGLSFDEKILDLKVDEALKAQMAKFGPWHEKALKSLKIQAQESKYTVEATDPRVHGLYLSHHEAYAELESQLIQPKVLACSQPYLTAWEPVKPASGHEAHNPPLLVGTKLMMQV